MSYLSVVGLVNISKLPIFFIAWHVETWSSTPSAAKKLI